MNTTVNKSLSILAHEIKNPLAICNGYLSMINDEDKVSRNNYLKIIKEEINRSLLILSEFSKNSSLYEKINLLDLFEDIKNTMEYLFINNNSKLIFLDTDNIYITGNYNKLKQAFINALKNSLESKDKDKLLVVIKTLEGKDNYIITITDNGCGMDKDELSKITNGSYTNKINGTGLGTVFIKSVISSFGGSIEYSSKKKIGTKLKIILPKEKSPTTFNSNNYN